jgi:hypothetical protein
VHYNTVATTLQKRKICCLFTGRAGQNRAHMHAMYVSTLYRTYSFPDLNFGEGGEGTLN